MIITETYNYGNTFVESLQLSTERLDLMFFGFFSTLICTVLLGNIIFFDSDIFVKTLRVGTICGAFIGIFYCLSRIMKSIAWAMACLYGLIICITYCNSLLTNVLFYFLAGAAFIYTLKSIKITKNDFWYGLAVGAIGAVAIIGARDPMTSFNMLNRLMVGDIHQDQLFHSSIAAMIKNYGVASTGLHGLVEIKYHVLSHWVMAGISFLSGVSVLEVYGIAQHIFFTPMLYFSIISLCLILNPNNNINTIILWGLICFFLTALPFCLFNKFGLYGVYFCSESYTLSLGILLVGSGHLYKRNLSYADIVLIIFLGMLMTEAKGSVGLIYMGLWWIRSLFFVKKNNVKVAFATSLVSIAVTMTVFASATASASIQKFWPFFFVGMYSVGGKYVLMAKQIYSQMGVINVSYLILAILSISFFMVMHFFVSWIAVGQSAYKKGLKFIWRSPVALYSLGAIGAGMLITSFLKDWIVYYFSSIAMFISLPTFLLLCYTGFMKYSTRYIRSEKKPLVIIASALVLIIIMSYSPIYDTYKHNVEIKKESSAFVKTLLHIQKNGDIDQCLTPSEALAEQNPIEKIAARPFVYPAASERPWINVVLADESSNERSVNFTWYGYEQYGLNYQQQVITIEPILSLGNGRMLKITPVDVSISKYEN